MNLGFTGSRSGMSQAQWHWTKRMIRQYLGACQNTLHHGCCIGADSQIHQMVLQLKSHDLITIGLIMHPPENDKHRAHLHGADQEWEPRPYLERNRDIVDCCDRLIACPSCEEQDSPRSGTWATIRYARTRVPITIIWRDGTVTEER